MILRLLAAAALGALHTPAYAFGVLWPLPLATLALLVLLLDRATPRAAFGLGWAYGAAWIGAAVWWLYISMHRYGGLPSALAIGAVALLAAALALYLGLAGWAYARWRCGRWTRDVPLFAALWLLAELARGLLFTGFPWAASGYSQADAPLAAWAPWLGVYGIGALLAASAAALASLRWRAAAAAALLLVASGWVGPGEFTRSAGTLSVTLVQTNVPQDEKFRPERLPVTLGWLQSMLIDARGRLVIAPETAVPLLPEQLEDLLPGWWPALQRHFETTQRGLLVGRPLGSFEQGYTNSVSALPAAPPDGAYRYDKHHLVPFGEFIPPAFRWFTQMMNIPLGDFARGPVDAPSWAFGGQRIGPNICYEDLFGEELAVRFRDASQAPTILANVSNIAWFGDTVAIPQHLQISRLRALELQRPMLRATNTGATAIVDHRGRVTAQLSPHQRGALDGVVEGRSGSTPYAWWAARLGLWPLVVLALLSVVALARARPAGATAPPSSAR